MFDSPCGTLPFCFYYLRGWQVWSIPMQHAYGEMGICEEQGWVVGWTSFSPVVDHRVIGCLVQKEDNRRIHHQRRSCRCLLYQSFPFLGVASMIISVARPRLERERVERKQLHRQTNERTHSFATEFTTDAEIARDSTGRQRNAESQLLQCGQVSTWHWRNCFIFPAYL